MREMKKAIAAANQGPGRSQGRKKLGAAGKPRAGVGTGTGTGKSVGEGARKAGKTGKTASKTSRATSETSKAASKTRHGAEYRIVFEDEWLLIIDKAAGLAVHAAQGVAGDDLLTLLRRQHPDVTLLHRLDREASGLLIASKRKEINAALQRDLEAHRVERVYTAVVAGVLALRPGQSEIVLDRPVSERARGRDALRRAPDADALPAVSRIKPLRALRDATVLEVRLDTGRKHQIRVHLAAIRHPILGDRRYGGPAAPRLGLHAGALAFAHPKGRQRLTLSAPPPPELLELIASREPTTTPAARVSP